MKSQNTIELNGKRYDATNGTMLGGVAPKVSVARNIDGFIKPPVRVQTSKRSAKSAAEPISILAPVAHHKPATPKQRPHVANHTQPHRPQSAVTLMRTAVIKPEKGLKQKVHVQVGLQHETPNLIAVKQSAYSVSEDRLARASSTERSPSIARHIAVVSDTAASVVPLAVQPVPVKPEASEEPTVPSPQPTNKPLDMFEHAIANASHYVDTKAHHAKFKKHRRSRALSFAAGSLALLVVAGFVAYQNSPSLQLKVASLRSGVTATTPNFKATGFSYNGATAADGKLTVGLKNQAGNYTVSQQDTNWDNVDLIQNIGATDASGSPTYSTVKAGNVDVYRFSNSAATWVANGKWYTVSGTGALTDSQVTTLVKNL